MTSIQEQLREIADKLDASKNQAYAIDVPDELRTLADSLTVPGDVGEDALWLRVTRAAISQGTWPEDGPSLDLFLKGLLRAASTLESMALEIERLRKIKDAANAFINTPVRTLNDDALYAWRDLSIALTAYDEKSK